ncbi:unnamed protein product [Rotaria sp. Silwood2]|nr:unnamed protein product [Rotaria sp. Silwood2]CAF2919083.1 unnamed protein product [Rotaria sp. Silwood2]CAF3232263.1 unnamed protein product [Rotaria sp. Silwood2]CAF3335001.1 unnamed protein product [Rotaria sp. Silwood2]CAF4011124.1 unnamed protein product [Rotaria sp. Silwood2]
MSASKIISSQCKICGVPTTHFYFGVKSCESCKIFFKRNAENRRMKLKCPYYGQCDINIHTRHACASCRLEKCLNVGMCVELIRCSHGKKKKKSTTSLPLVPLVNRKIEQSQKLITLNLLERDQSLLTIDQWILLSNLIHSYDEHNALAVVKKFATNINHLHPKLRYKIDSATTIEVSTIICQSSETFVQSNHDINSLPVHDRSIVLRGAVDNISCLGGPWILRQSELIENSAFRNGLEITYGSIPYQLTLKVISSLDQNMDLIKLTLSLFAFCTSNCTVFGKNASFLFLTDMKSVLNIQNIYAEAIWKYLLYKYAFEESVIRFSHLIESILAAITVRTHLQTVNSHTDVIDTLIENIEKVQLNKNAD